jgi:hypothetical protein
MRTWPAIITKQFVFLGLISSIHTIQTSYDKNFASLTPSPLSERKLFTGDTF